MTLGPLMADVEGYELTPEDRELLQHPAIGGVILFARNYGSAEQVAALVADIHQLRDPHLLVAVDQEGGRVQRFKDEFTHLPPLACLGRIYDTDKPRAKHLAKTTGWLMASELRAVGVDLSFAPVLDLDFGVSSIIGDRALHQRPEVVAELAQLRAQRIVAGSGARRRAARRHAVEPARQRGELLLERARRILVVQHPLARRDLRDRPVKAEPPFVGRGRRIGADLRTAGHGRRVPLVERRQRAVDRGDAGLELVGVRTSLFHQAAELLVEARQRRVERRLRRRGIGRAEDAGLQPLLHRHAAAGGG